MELDERVNALKEIIRKTPTDLLQEHVYVCMANTCLLLTAYKHRKSSKGWSRDLVDDAGQPMLTYKQQEMLEDAFDKAPWISEVLESPQQQKGGAGFPPTLTSSGSSFVKDITSVLPNAADVSLDLMLEKFLKKSDEMDQFWSKFAYNTPGFAKLLNRDIQIPYVPVPVPVKPLVNFLIMLIDSIRLSAGLAGFNIHSLTLLVMLEELVTGQWRQMITTGLAFISPSGMAAGVIAKYIVNAWTLINPELRDEIFRDMVKGTKSVFLGFLLWAATNLPPEMVRKQMEAVLSRARGMVEGVDAKVKELEEKGSVALKPLGKKLQFTGVDLSKLTKISIQDIQNLQALAQWDLLVCSSEFQSILQPLIKQPILRLIIELFNIPTVPEATYKLCGPEPFKSVAERVAIAFEPQIVDSGEKTEAEQLVAAVKEEVAEEAEKEQKEEAEEEKEEAKEEKEEAKEEVKEDQTADRSERQARREERQRMKATPPLTALTGGRRKPTRSVKGRKLTPKRITRRHKSQNK
jgi:hypothetical protein